MSGSSPRKLMSFAAHASSRMEGSVEILMLAIERLRNTLDAENARIASGQPVDFHDFNLRKSQGLLELNRHAPNLAGLQLGPALAAALGHLQTRLETNRRLLSTQLKAARAVSDIITRAIRDSQSDGTYSDRYWMDE